MTHDDPFMFYSGRPSFLSSKGSCHHQSRQGDTVSTKKLVNSTINYCIYSKFSLRNKSLFELIRLNLSVLSINEINSIAQINNITGK